jgi:hypothetical protein
MRAQRPAARHHARRVRSTSPPPTHTHPHPHAHPYTHPHPLWGSPRDRKFKPYVDMYAKDEEAFFKVGGGGGRARAQRARC